MDYQQSRAYVKDADRYAGGALGLDKYERADETAGKSPGCS